MNAWSPTTRSYTRPLAYYSKAFSEPFQPVSTTQVLQEVDGFGECFSFAQLFQDALWANGVDNIGTLIQEVSAKAFLVKEWDFSETGSSGDPNYPWEMVFSERAGEMVPPPDPFLPDQFGDLTNDDTLSGQHTDTPIEKVFGSHYIVHCSNADEQGHYYYDPSYGVTYNDALDFQQRAIAGFGRILLKDQSKMFVRQPEETLSITFNDMNQGHR